MGRIQFIEFEDLNWWPKFIRDATTDNLQFALNFADQYAPIIPHLRQALKRAKAHRIVDLCSGGGGPWLRMHRELNKDENPHIEICLTDRYPNLRAFEYAQIRSQNCITFHPDPVDAMRLPSDLKGFRTFFSSFHHFRPQEARKILQDAFRSRQGIGVFEVTARKPLAILLICFAPLWVLLFTPFIRPFRWSRLIWTYLIPVVPIVALFDGMVSCLRTYSESELAELVEDFQVSEYRWDIGEEKVAHSPVPITYLIGYPEEYTSTS